MKFYKDGRWWFTKKKDAIKNMRKDERIYFNPNIRAYYIARPKVSFWDDFFGD